MARSSVQLNASVDDAWVQLQRLETWEGVAGIENLRDASHDAEGDLSSFRFTIDTAVGRVDGRAKVDGESPTMVIVGEQKGLAITISLTLRPDDDDRSLARIEANSKATSFLSKPLELALNALLDTGLDDEAAKIADRIH